MTSSFATIDVSAWVGQYPFRGISGGSVEHLRQKMRQLNIVRAIVSPYEGVFWENNLDAFEQWAAQLKDQKELELWPVVNPAMPGQIDAFRRLWEKYRFVGFRLAPNYHGYRLDDGCVTELMAFAAEHDLVAQLVTRIADERWHWMLKIAGVSNDDVLYFTGAFAGQRMIISALNGIDFLTPRLKQQPRLLADISRVRGPIFAVEELVRRAGSDHLVFGSLWPIQIIEATLWQVLEARMEDGCKAALLSGNVSRLIEVP